MNEQALITSLSLQPPSLLREVCADNIFDLMWWCKYYEEQNKFPATILNRFAIGFYQIHQGMLWKDGGVNKYESYAAAILHFIMVAVRLNLPIDEQLEISFKEYGSKFIHSSAEDLLCKLSCCQQQLIYGCNTANKTKRKSRYDKDKLAKNLGEVIKILMEIIPAEYRIECFEKASSIMTRELK